MCGKKGFFILRDCGQTALKLCQMCNRPTCAEHGIVLADDVLMCVDCNAKQKSESEVTGNYTQYDRGWTHSYRHRYYQNSHYSPYYSGIYFDHYYDDYDIRAFDQDLVEPAAFDESEEHGFFDS